MNKNNFFKNTLFIISLSLITFITVSCASTKKVIEQPAYEDGLYDETPDENNEELSTESTAPAMTDTFLGEFNPILLKETICLLKSGKKMRPKELAKTYLIPTSNKVEVHFRDLTNQVCIILDKQERDQIVEAANKFLEQYESKTLHRGKVNRKTAYFTSKAGVYFGLTGYGNGTDKCDYYANSEIFDKHAYFLLNFVPSRCEEGSGFTPSEKIYFSPTQLKDFLEILDQNYLNSQVEGLRKRAYAY